jgi:beta-glucuronidase
MVAALLQLAHVASRPRSSLNGAWHFLVDAYDRGEIQRFWQNRTPAQPGELIEYGFAEAPTLDVPGDWNTQRRELFFYEGIVWYQRDFEASPAPGTRQVLHFGAAN